MGRKFFTSDWHNGEKQAPNTHSFLRPRPTEQMVEEWIKQCHEKISKEDTIFFVGDLGLTLDDLDIYLRLPACYKVLVKGDKEYNSKYFTAEAFDRKIADLGVFNEVHTKTIVRVGEIEYFVSHKPSDCFNTSLPAAICGHIHGIWRTTRMVNKKPIINVGIDAWGGIVTEEFITHQYNAMTQPYGYDREAFPQDW